MNRLIHLSLKELSEEYGMTRQGVHDLIKRCDKSLSEYESKLHMAEKYARIRNMVLQMKVLAEDKDNNGSKISSIATELLEIL